MGIVGIGGMGTIGIKIAAAVGHEVIAISTNPAKEELAKSKGASHFVFHQALNHLQNKQVNVISSLTCFLSRMI